MNNWKRILQPANSPKYPTPEFIRIKLGLLPWTEFKLSVNMLYRELDLDRYSGRTTKMLINAIYYSQFRKVYVAGYNQKYTRDLVGKAHGLCKILDINHNNILPLPSNWRRETHSYIFFDHYIKK